MQLRYAVILLLIGTGWGLTHPLSKLASAAGHPPFLMLLWQTVIVVAVLGAITLARGRRLPWHPRALRFYGIVAVLGTVVPNASFYISIARLPAGIMSIVISAVPLIAFPIALALGADRFSMARLTGLGLGLAGVLLIAAPGAGLPAGAVVALPVAMIGPLFYALEANFVARNGTEGMDPVQAMAGASLVGLVVCVALVLATGQWQAPPMPPGRAEWALLASSTLHALLYASYVWLAAHAGAVFASQSSYLITASGLLWSMALLGERFSPVVWLAMAVMLAGVALVRPRARDAAAAA